MLSVSNKLKAAVKLNDVPAYRIAQKANVDPCTLSKLICGITQVKIDDPRVIAVGEILGIPPEDCFQEVEIEVS